MSAWYRAGSVSVTNGSVSVVGVDTLWASQAAVGDAFSIDGDKLYEIAAITDNTHLTLQSAYTGTTAGAVSYGIIRNFTGTTQAELAASLAELLNSWQTREDQYRNWQTGTATGGTAGDGAYPITDILGNTYSYYSPAKLNKIASGLFGHNTSTTTGLTLGYLGGVMLVDGVITTIADGTLVLSASSTNYVEATRAGVVSKNTTGFTAGRIPIREVVTGTAAITSIAERLPRDVPVIGRLSKSVAGNASVTLTAAEARNQVMEFTGALTGNISVIVPSVVGSFAISNSTSGSYALTVKTSAGTGIIVTQGKTSVLVCNGTNVINAFTDFEAVKTYLSGTFAALAGSVSQEFSAASIELGHASDTTLTRVSAGVAAIEGSNIVTTASLAGGILPASVTTLTASGNATLSTVTIGGSDSTRNVKLNIAGTMSKDATTLSGLSLSPTLTGGASTTVMRNLIMNATFSPVANNLTLFNQYNQSVFTGTTSPSSLYGCNQTHILAAGALGGTITNLYGYTATLSINTAATTNITTYAGFQCSNIANGASMTVGTARAFVGGMAAGTNRRNLYMYGTAPNHLAGALMIGSDTDDTVNKLQVTGSIKATTTITTGGYNVATLPAGVTGARAYVTDATAPTWNAALTGGGAVKCPAFYNGSAWVAA